MWTFFKQSFCQEAASPVQVSKDHRTLIQLSNLLTCRLRQFRWTYDYSLLSRFCSNCNRKVIYIAYSDRPIHIFALKDNSFYGLRGGPRPDKDVNTAIGPLGRAGGN